VCDRDHKNRAESKVQLAFSGNKCSHTQVTFVSLALGYFQDVIKGLFVAKEIVFVVDFHAFALKGHGESSDCFFKSQLFGQFLREKNQTSFVT
jgi:hypothetical protein